MKILFDHQAFEMQRFGGVSRLYTEIIPRMQSMGIECVLGIKESDNVHLRDSKLVNKIHPLGYAHQAVFDRKKLFRGQRFITRFICKAQGYHNDLFTINRDYCVHLLEKIRYDIFEPTFFDPYFLPHLKGHPFAMEVHDMIPELFPEYFPIDDFQILNKRRLCPLADFIHVPSEKTKEDLVNILNIPDEKVVVISRGIPHIPVPTNTISRPIDNPYLLFIGERRGYKNFDLLLNELAIIQQRNKDIHLLCTGRPFDNDELKHIDSLGLLPRVHHIFATDENLYAIYHHALAFIYPSAYEGFGLPILEAFVCGCPVMLNDASCFPEVGGDAAIYFDINRKGDLAEHIDAILRSSIEDRYALIARGHERAKQFSWEKSAQMLSEVYRNIL